MVPLEPTPDKMADFELALLLAAAVSPLLLLGGLAVAALGAPLLGLAFGLGLAGVGLIVFYKGIRARGRRYFVITAELVVLLGLPAWGLVYNHVTEARCEVSSCDVGTSVFRPLAEPEVFGLLALHLVAAVAYAVSRRRPAALHAAAELFAHATLLVGVVLHMLLAVHFGWWMVAGLAFPPLFLPCLTPLLAGGFFAAELRARLRRRGTDARLRVAGLSSPYREADEDRELVLPKPIHAPAFRRALLLSPALLGLYAIVQTAWLGGGGAALQVFTRTCGHTLSQLDVVIVPQNCHYLCTVAARGHAWLVRPERLGRRGGAAIVVNRQLAVANAFEDLLLERWPRFGGTSRRLYDRVGLPISRHIHARWVSDVVYLAMKPAEWMFYLVLLLLDPGPPEARIERMYR